jgi:cytochrome c553
MAGKSERFLPWTRIRKMKEFQRKLMESVFNGPVRRRPISWCNGCHGWGGAGQTIATLPRANGVNDFVERDTARLANAAGFYRIPWQRPDRLEIHRLRLGL